LVTVDGLRPSGRLDEITRTRVCVTVLREQLRVQQMNYCTNYFGAMLGWPSLVSSYLSRSPGRK